jgi:hypothetical protein
VSHSLFIVSIFPNKLLKFAVVARKLEITMGIIDEVKDMAMAEAKESGPGIIEEVKKHAEKHAENKIYEEGGYTALWQYRAAKWYGTVPTCNCLA